MSSPAPVLERRDDLAGIPTYSAAPPTSVPVVVRASSNEAPGPVPDDLMEVMVAALRSATRYPRIAGQDLADAVAAVHGVPASQVVVGDGALALLERILLAYVRPGENVVMAWRSYEAYPLSTQVAHGRARLVPLTADGKHDLARMASAIDQHTRIVIICNPNNPTGTVVPWPQLEDFLDSLPGGVLAVIDEAYAEYADDAAADRPPPAGLVARPHVVVLRTFSKAHGLAGLRAGYAIAPARIAAAIRSVSLPFPVSAVAAAAATCSLAHPEWLAERVRRTRVERDRIGSLISGRGLPVLPSQGNFLWLPLGAASTAFAGWAADRGVLVRPFADEGVRVTVGDPLLGPALRPVLEAWSTR